MKYEKYYKGRNDLFSGIVLSAFSIAYLIGATRIKIPKMLSSSFLNASSVPKLWGTLLLILGIILVIRGVRVMKAEKAAGNAPEKKTAAQMVKDFWSANRAVIEMFVVLLIYIALIQPVGFLISTFHAVSINFIFQIISSFQCLYNLRNRNLFRISLQKISSLGTFHTLYNMSLAKS